MQRLTVAGRLLITLLILAGIYFGLKTFGGIDLLKKFGGDRTEQTTESPSLPSTVPAEENAAPAPENGSSSGASDATTSTARKTFDYTPPAPVNGKLKGVVELGASGFNSFIVTMDRENRWKLEKADFGNSLVLENMATDLDIREGLKKYIAGMLDYGVGARDIHFVVSSGAAKADVTQKIVKALKGLNYVVNTVTPEQEGKYGLRVVLPAEYASRAFVVDIGSGNTKISWQAAGQTRSLEAPGAKYFEKGTADAAVYDEVKGDASQVPDANRETCFIIGGIPFELAKQVRNGKERYTVLKLPAGYEAKNAKQKAGLNIYKAVADATGCRQFVFDWDSNFTIGFLLELPK
jgi:hypothetical protein